VSILKVSDSTPKIESQHLNLGVDIKSFGVYPESLRVNPKILSVNTQLLWSTLKFGGQPSNVVVNPQILVLTLKFWC